MGNDLAAAVQAGRLSTGKRPRVSVTVCFVIGLFSFIYCSVVFIAVRAQPDSATKPRCGGSAAEPRRCTPGWNGACTGYFTLGSSPSSPALLL